MFEKIVIRRHETRGTQIDAGALAEALLFYGTVHLLLDGGTLAQLLKSVGPHALLALIEQRRITATWLTDLLGVQTQIKGPLSYHRFVAFRLEKQADGKRPRDRDMVLQIFEEALDSSGATRTLAKRFIDQLEFRANEPVRHLPDGSIVPATEHGLIAQTNSDVEDPAYLRAAIEAGLGYDVPEYSLPADWDFELFQTSDGYVHSTNLDFAAINREFHKRPGMREETISPAWLINRAITARADLMFAADYMSEFLTDPLSSKLIRLRLNALLMRRSRSAESIETFLAVQLDEGRALREAINSGERSFDEFIRLLDRSDKFKEWIRGQNADASLLAEYQSAVTSETWMNKLPQKAVRFMLFALGGLALEQIAPGGLGAATGIGIGLADSLFLDKLLSGWRPSHFVEGPLKRFVDG